MTRNDGCEADADLAKSRSGCECKEKKEQNNTSQRRALDGKIAGFEQTTESSQANSEPQ